MTADDLNIGDVCKIVSGCHCAYMAQLDGLDCEVIALIGEMPTWSRCCPLASKNENVFQVRLTSTGEMHFPCRDELRKKRAAEQRMQIPVQPPKEAPLRKVGVA